MSPPSPPDQHWLFFKWLALCGICDAMWPRKTLADPKGVLFLVGELPQVRLADKLAAIWFPKEIPAALFTHAPHDQKNDLLFQLHDELIGMHVDIYTSLVAHLFRHTHWARSSFWETFMELQCEYYGTDRNSVAMARDLKHVVKTILSLRSARRRHDKELNKRCNANPEAVQLYEERKTIWDKGDARRQKFYDDIYGHLDVNKALLESPAGAGSAVYRGSLSGIFKFGKAVVSESSQSVYKRIRSRAKTPAHCEHAEPLIAGL